MNLVPFRDYQRLLDWPDFTLEQRCRCGFTSCPPLKLLAARHGNLTFAELVPLLFCDGCKQRCAPVYLVAGLHRDRCTGPPCWSVPLVDARPPGPVPVGTPCEVLELAAPEAQRAREA